MEVVGFVFGVVGFVLALAALNRAKRVAREAADGAEDARRRVRNLEEALERETELTRRLLAAVKDGSPITREMILDGRTWADATPEEGTKMVEEGELFVLDVRTKAETDAGIIPGASLIPIDELEERASEVPRTAKRILVYCAGGGRSAAACEFRASEGYEGLFNLTGGFMSWTGPVARPQ